MSRYREDDINLLVRPFRDAVQVLLERMRAAGYRPILRDGLRTREEASKNASKGTGIADSMHCYGVAADIICDVHGWRCDASGCKFFHVLGPKAEALGMTWGGRWRRRDLPHVQAIPVSVQRQIRRAAPAEIEEICAEYLRRG